MAQSHPSRAQQRWQEHPLMTVLLEECRRSRSAGSVRSDSTR